MVKEHFEVKPDLTKKPPPCCLVLLMTQSATYNIGEKRSTVLLICVSGFQQQLSNDKLTAPILESLLEGYKGFLNGLDDISQEEINLWLAWSWLIVWKLVQLFC